MRILVVDDEAAVSDVVRRILHREGCEVDVADRLSRARPLAMARSYDAIVLDYNLPDGTGTGFIRELREANIRTPVLMLTAQTDEPTTVGALDAGADDYVTKPFSVGSFMARVRAVVRRGPGSAGELIVGNVVLNRLDRVCRVGGVEVKLTPRELAVFETLLSRFGAVVPRGALEERSAQRKTPGNSNALDVAMLHLRRKLAAADADVVIAAERGVGFVLRRRVAE